MKTHWIYKHLNGLLWSTLFIICLLGSEIENVSRTSAAGVVLFSLLVIVAILYLLIHIRLLIRCSYKWYFIVITEAEKKNNSEQKDCCQKYTENII